MGFKRVMIVLFVCIFAGAIVSVLLGVNTTNYSKRLIDAFADDYEIQVSDVFRFDFDCAYVFNDCYISGDGFSTRYGLDLSISAVETGISENIHRIVFVDRDGKLVYEYQYDTNQINFNNEGVIIYPSTRLTKAPPLYPGTLTLHFESTDYYAQNNAE